MIERPLRIGYVLPVLEPGGAERQVVSLASAMPPNRGVPGFIVLGSDGPAVEAARAAGLVVHVLGASRERDVGRVAFALEGARLAARFVQLVRRRRYDILDAWLFPAYALVAVTRPLIGVWTLVAGRRSLARWKDGDRLVAAAGGCMGASDVGCGDCREQRGGGGGCDPCRGPVLGNGCTSSGTASDPRRLRPTATERTGARLRRSAGVPADWQADRSVSRTRDRRRGWATSSLRSPCDRCRRMSGWRSSVTARVVPTLSGRLRRSGWRPSSTGPDLARTLGGSSRRTTSSSVRHARRDFPTRSSRPPPRDVPSSRRERAGPARSLTDGRTGLLVQVGDPIALRSALDRLLDDPALAMRLGAAAAA